MNKNNLTTLVALLACIACFAPANTAPVEEIDLSDVDDSAEAAGNAPRINATESGYIDISCDDAPISSILQQFRRTANVNILSGDSSNLTRRVSANLHHTKWEDALKSILGLANYRVEKRSGVWHVIEKTIEQTQNATRRFALKYASAQDLADLFNGVALETTYRERTSLKTGDKDAAKDAANASRNQSKDNLSALAGLATATAFADTNTLILKGTEADLETCAQIIEELDRPITQVYIEARFIELSNQALHKLGVQWDQLKSWGASVKSLKAGYESNDGKAANYGLFQNQKTVSKTSTTTKSGSTSTSASSDGTSNANVNDNDNENINNNENTTYQGLVPSAIGEAVGAGASAASMGWRNASTFSGQISAEEFSLALSAFESISDVKIFSNPRIIVANGKEAEVDMTTKEPNVEITSDRSGTEGQYLSVSTKLEPIPGNDKIFGGKVFFSYGISLKVKPRVSSTGLISVEVAPSISEKKSDKYVAGASSDSVYTTYPIIDMKSILTEFTMKDGATAVIGGLTQTTEEDTDSGIPYLRKIPWIGPRLFGWKSREKVQKEILVCVTVGIANPETLEKDAGLPTNAVLGREYVEGRRFEPGNRPNALKRLQSLDTRSLDDIRAVPYPPDEDVDLGDDPDLEEKKPVAKPAEKPAKKVAAKKVVAKPAKKVAAKPAEKPAKKLDPAKPIEKIPEPKPIAKPIAKPTPEPAAKPVAKPVEKPIAKPVEKPVETPAPVAKPEPVAVPASAAATEVAPAEDEQPAARKSRARRRH